jgi:magnesium chelatase family protein
MVFDRGFGNQATITHLSTKDIQKYCKINNENARIASDAMRNLDLSARAYSRILKVAKTTVDLAGCPSIETAHCAKALQYRPRFSRSMVNHMANTSPVA